MPYHIIVLGESCPPAFKGQQRTGKRGGRTGEIGKVSFEFVSLSGPRPPPPRTWSRQAGRRPPPPRVTPGIYTIAGGGGGEGKGASPPPLRLPLLCSGTFYRKTLFAAGREGRGEVELTFRLSRSSSLSPAHTCSIRRIVSLARQPRNILKRTLTSESSSSPSPLFFAKRLEAGV